MAERRITGRVNKPGRGLGLGIPDFTSSDQTVAADTQLDVAHGLGAVPSLVQVSMKCTTDDVGYVASTSDEIIGINTNAGTTDRGVIIFKEATNVSIVTGADIVVIGASTKNDAGITEASWRWVVRAWK